MIDLGNTLDRQRLWKSINQSRDSLDLWDFDRTEMLRDFAGPLYSPYSPRTQRYVNKLNTTATIYQTALCFNNPQFKITSFDQKLWPFCRKYEVNVNKVIENINLKAVLAECVLDAFFLLGAAKVRMADAGLKEIEPNLWLDPGKPWVDRISFSDLILDMPAKSLRSMRFYGDRYRAPFEAVQGRDDFDEKVLKKLSPSSKQNQNADSDRADQIALGNSVDDDELEPMCWLMDIFLPRERLLVTFSADNDALAPLKVVEWDGSAMGPYKFLTFGYVPDNVMPSTPAEQLVLLDRLMNRLYRKLAQQANRQKNFVLGEKGDEKDLLIVKQAADGEYVVVKNPKSATPVSFPGPDANLNAFFLAAGEIYNVQAGNERALGGLGTEAETATQEQMLARGAGGRVGWMKGAVNEFASEIGREIGNLMWEDPSLTISSTMEVENTDYRVDSSWKPGDRKGLKDHYDFRVEPNSMAFRPPEMKQQIIDGFCERYVNLLPAIQAGAFDGQEYARIYAENNNCPEVLRVAKQMRDEMTAGDPHQATKAPNTSREVVRRSVNSGPQGQGMAQVMGQMMQGNKASQGVTVG